MWTTNNNRTRNNNEGKTRISLTIDNDLLAEIDEIAKETERHRSQMIRCLLKEIINYGF